MKFNDFSELNLKTAELTNILGGLKAPSQQWRRIHSGGDFSVYTNGTSTYLFSSRGFIKLR